MPPAHIHEAAGRAPRATRRLLAALLAPFVAATLIGLVLLWPDGGAADLSDALGAPAELIDATVVAVATGPCRGAPAEVEARCLAVDVRLHGGPDAGAVVPLPELTEDDPGAPEVGDEVVVGFTPDAAPGFEYHLADRQRRAPLAVLAALFVAAVVLLGRWYGVRALLGLGLSLGVLVVFVLPALLEGSDPVAVALTGASAIAFTAVFLAHGVNARTATAVLGALGGLALTGLLAWVFVEAAGFTGLADEEAGLLRISAAVVDLRGLLLAGIVIGALGVLDDVTVTQVSAVWEIRRADPRLGARPLYRAGLRVGRDHIASTVNTLVLAYAGAALPLLLLFTQADQDLVDVVNAEVVAVEVVRTLVGSIGLVAAVPVTTALAAVVVASHGVAAREVGGNDDEEDRAEEQPRSSDPRAYRSRRETRFWTGT